MSKQDIVLSGESVSSRIYTIRGKQVMLDRDLAVLYGVTTSRLNEQVKRNSDRFPQEFMFQLTQKEIKDWMSQIAISNKERMGVRKMPFVFTEQGVSMLSAVLKSPTSVKVSIQIMNTFVKLRALAFSKKDITDKIELLERRYADHDRKFVAVFEALKELLKKSKEAKCKNESIGFHV